MFVPFVLIKIDQCELKILNKISMKYLLTFLMTYFILSSVFGQEELTLEQKEFIIQFSIDSYNSFNSSENKNDEFKIQSHFPKDIKNDLNIKKLAETFTNNIKLESINNNEIILTSELVDFPNIPDIKFDILWNSVFNTNGSDILRMTKEEMEKVSKSSSDYKPYINGTLGFMTNINIIKSDNNVVKISGEIKMKIPVLYDKIVLDKSDLNVSNCFLGINFKILRIEDNTIILETIELNNDLKILPLNKQDIEYYKVLLMR